MSDEGVNFQPERSGDIYWRNLARVNATEIEILKSEWGRKIDEVSSTRVALSTAESEVRMKDALIDRQKKRIESLESVDIVRLEGISKLTEIHHGEKPAHKKYLGKGNLARCGFCRALEKGWGR